MCNLKMVRLNTFVGLEDDINWREFPHGHFIMLKTIFCPLLSILDTAIGSIDVEQAGDTTASQSSEMSC